MDNPLTDSAVHGIPGCSRKPISATTSHLAPAPHPPGTCRPCCEGVAPAHREPGSAVIDPLSAALIPVPSPAVSWRCQLSQQLPWPDTEGVCVQQQQVLWFDVPVYYIASLMCKRQELQQLAHHVGCLRLGEMPLSAAVGAGAGRDRVSTFPPWPSNKQRATSSGPARQGPKPWL